MGRLFETQGSGGPGLRRLLYDGDELVAEYDNAGNVVKRYVHGASVDDPIAEYTGTTLATRSFLHGDHQGSIVATSDASGNATINKYDEYGIPAAGNAGRFGYTGQIWIPELGLWHYKARAYSPGLGRFMQVDPVGYEDQVNLYAYVGNDPLNWGDPTGLAGECPDNKEGCPPPKPETCASRVGVSASCSGGTTLAMTAGTPKKNDRLRQGHNKPPKLLPILGRLGGLLTAIFSLGGDTCDECNPPPSSFDETRTDHIFRNEKGHYRYDTPANRQRLIDTWANGRLVRTDQYGNKTYARLNGDGTENWARVRNNKIVNGGLNETPRWMLE